MRWFVATAVLLGLVLVVLLAGRADRSRTSAAAATSSATAADDLPAPAAVHAIEPAPESARSADSRQVVQPSAIVPGPASSTTSPAPDDCTVFGRVVDGNGRPLPEVVVRLEAYEVWAEGHEIPRLPGRYDTHGWELRTDALGSFRVVTPVPTADRVSLRITPDPFHDSVWEILGGDDAEARDRLHAGDNDLGLFRLVATGAIGGRVVDEAGLPLAGAELTLANERWSTLGRETETDTSGGYLLGHVKPGSFGVNTKREGYLSEFRKPIQVEPGRITAGVDFFLRVAPTLGGVVVDERGNGLAGASLWCWPQSSGSGAGARSTADGSFTVHLPQDEPYTLEVELEGYETFGLDDRSTHYAPGTRDLRIVLERSANARTSFRVVDAATHAPIERFGLEIERDRGSGAERHGWTDYRARPQPADHPGGELEAAARLGLDLVTVCAPGYLRYIDDVRHDSVDAPLQTIQLVPGGTLTGRVLSSGVPVPGAAVRLQPGEMERGEDGTGVFDPDSSRGGGVAMLATSTDDVGRFVFEMLDPGIYRLLVRHAGGEVVELVPLEVPARGPVDTGDLVLFRGATLLGTVLVPPRRPTAGLVVYLDEALEGGRTTTDELGRFRFEGVTAGKHVLTLGELPGLLAWTTAVVTVAAGETREVVIDAREFGTCEVALTIELAGRPAEGMRVMLLPVADPERRIELGTTGVDGRVTGSAAAMGDARVELTGRDWPRLVHPLARVALELDREVELTVRFELGSLLLELPSTLRLPAKGWIRLVLALPDGTVVDTRGFDVGQVNDLGLRCENVVAGVHEGTLTVHDASAPTELIPEGGGFRAGFPSLYRTNFHATVQAGASTEIQLR